MLRMNFFLKKIGCEIRDAVYRYIPYILSPSRRVLFY